MTIQRDQLARQVADHLATEIGELEPGTRLAAQGELVRRLGVSRAVVREAFRLLEARGLIESQQGRHAVVRGLDHSLLSHYFDLSVHRPGGSITRLLELRLIVEVAIVRLAAARATPSQVAAMRSATALMYEHRDDPPGFIDADILFHVRLAEASGNELLAHLIAALREPLRASQIVTREGAGRRGDVHLQALRAHERILDAVSRHDTPAAAEAMRAHLRDTFEDLRAARPEETEGFDISRLYDDLYGLPKEH